MNLKRPWPLLDIRPLVTCAGQTKYFQLVLTFLYPGCFCIVIITQLHTLCSNNHGIHYSVVSKVMLSMNSYLTHIKYLKYVPPITSVVYI